MVIRWNLYCCFVDVFQLYVIHVFVKGVNSLTVNDEKNKNKKSASHHFRLGYYQRLQANCQTHDCLCKTCGWKDC